MNIETSFQKLKAYCEHEDFKGWDPYDGLNSTLFNSMPFIPRQRLPRLAWIQLMKRSPLNLRRLTGVPKEHNAKGLALFLTGYCNLYRQSATAAYLDKIHYLAEKLISMQSRGYHGSCWGYNFDWQARAFFQPRSTPTVVATTFAAEALLDAYQITYEQHYLNAAVSSADFILKDLQRTYDDKGNFAFSYSPLDNTQVYNASLLGSRLLARLHHYTRDASFLEAAKKSVDYCCDRQREDGSWTYGTLPFHQWIDNFHTGYNLESIAIYQHYSFDHSYEQVISKGTEYYLKTFFTEDGRCRYYSHQMYPLDIHNPAQLVSTLTSLGLFHKHKALIDKVMDWTISNMQHKNGYFYHQLRRGLSARTPYMRWAQAWMFYALSIYQLAIKTPYHENRNL